MSQPLALIFPGQGSQQLGMLRELAERYSVVGTTFEEASDIHISAAHSVCLFVADIRFGCSSERQIN